MSNQKLKYVRDEVISKLWSEVFSHRKRYLNKDFKDMSSADGWNIELSIEVDLSHLEKLDPTKGVEQEVSNSLLVWKALHNLTPSLACENRIWSRLSHVECLQYSRKRWLAGVKEEELVETIRTHFFAPGRTGYRDDHSVSRLWWNAYIAKKVRPNDQAGALELMIKRADIRSNIVERASTARRVPVTAALLRLMEREASVTSKEGNFRDLMKVVNRQCGGVLFEALSDNAADAIMNDCFQKTNITP